MSERERFLRDLERCLTLRSDRRADALAELNAHIEEGIARGEQEAEVVVRLGAPKEIAARLNATEGTPSLIVAAALPFGRWVTLVGLVVLIAVVGAAFVDYEMNRAHAAAAQANAANARLNCLYGRGGGAPFTPAERKRRHERCDRLPGPLRQADRVERRWDRRGPWYGFAAAAILLLTAVMFAPLRRRPTSAALDSALSRPWRIATVAVSFAVGIMVWAALVYLVVDRWWVRLVEGTGGSTHDCHYAGNDCGVLGEFTEAHPRILLSLIAAASAIPAAAIIWSFSRLFRSLDNEQESHAELGPPVRN